MNKRDFILRGNDRAAETDEPRYTLADFRALATEYANEHHNEARLAIQQMTKGWLGWIERRQKGAANVRAD